jgi:hypothetical protein
MEISEYVMRHKNTVGGRSHCEWTLRRPKALSLLPEGLPTDGLWCWQVETGSVYKA